MDENIKIKRNKKSDKSKRTYDITGGFTKKHIRIIEEKKSKNIKVKKSFITK